MAELGRSDFRAASLVMFVYNRIYYTIYIFILSTVNGSGDGGNNVQLIS